MHTKGKRDFTPYTANSKVTKHPKFLPRKHGTEAEQKAAGRTRTSCAHPLHPFTAGPVLADVHTGCLSADAHTPHQMLQNKTHPCS